MMCCFMGAAFLKTMLKGFLTLCDCTGGDDGTTREKEVERGELDNEEDPWIAQDRDRST